MKKIKLLYKKYKEIINYIIVGGMTTVVGLGIYYILVISVLDPLKPVELQIANICSWIGAVAFAYFTNRKFVFESHPNLFCPEWLRCLLIWEECFLGLHFVKLMTNCQRSSFR